MPSAHLQRVCLLAAMLLLSVSACGDDSVPMFRALETEHFVVLRQVGLPPACDSLGEWLEGYYTVFGRYLGIQRSASRKITYKQFNSLTAARAACDGAAVNCYFPDSDTIVSVASLYPHEIAHVFETLVGGPRSGPAFFSEGVASVLGEGFSYDTPDRRVDPSVPLETLLEDAAFRGYEQNHDSGVLYSSTAGFVRYVIDNLGKDPFLAFYGSLDGVTQGSQIESAFAAQFGQSLKDTIQEWRTSPQPIIDDLVVVSAGCEISPEIPTGGSLAVDPECAQSGFRFEVPASGRQDLLIDGEELAYVQLRSCDKGDLIPGSAILSGRGGSEIRVAVAVPPGSYEGIVSSAPATVSVPAVPVTVDFDGTCSTERVPAEIGGANATNFALVSRWGTTETNVAFDVSVASPGLFDILSISGVGVTDPASTASRVFYSCPSACEANPDQACGRDDIWALQTGQDTVHDVFDIPVNAGDLLHFETGPRAVQDWSYSVRVDVRPPN
jgi:hypothetical protein